MERKGEGKRKGRERKEREESRKRKGEERERDREKRKSAFRRSELVGQEAKSVYSTRATLQEVGIFPTLVYFHPKRLFLKYGNAALF